MNVIQKRKSVLFYCAYFMYLFATVMQSTMFTNYQTLSRCFVLLRYLACGIALIKIGLDLYFRWRGEECSGQTVWYRGSTAKRAIVYSFFLLLIGLASFVPDDRSLVFVAVLLLAADGLNVKSIFISTFWVQLVLLIGIVLSSSLGIIPDLLFKRTSIPIRHALGYTYPSVMMSYFCFTIFLYLWIRDCELTGKELAVLELTNYLLFLLTDSRTSFLLLLIGLPVCWLIGKYTRIFSKLDVMKDIRKIPVVSRLCAHLFDYLAVYLSLFLFLLCMLGLDNGFSRLVNSALSDRVYHMANAVSNYGIHLFGSNIDWIGFGGSLDTDSLMATYNFVDCSYGYILLNFGILIFVLMLALWVCINKYVRKKYNLGHMFILIMVLLYCFIEPRLLELQMNPFLLLIAPLAGGRSSEWKQLFRK